MKIMNKNKELAKNTIIISIGKICTQFMTFFLLPLYTALLTTEEYGTVDLFGTYSSLLMPIILMQIDQALFRYMIDKRGNHDEISEIVSTSVLFVIIQCILMSIIFFIVQAFLTLESKIYLLGYILASAWSTMMLQLARGFGRNVIYAGASFLSSAVQILCNVLFLAVLKMGMVGMLRAIICGNLACVLYIAVSIKIWKYLRFKYSSKSELKILLRYSIPLIPNALCWWALNASDKIIVSTILGVGYNGLCAIGHKFAFIVITFYNIFNISWTESAAVHINDFDAQEFFQDTIDNMFKLFSCLCIGIIACMPFAFNILVNSTYREAYGLIPVYMLGSLFNVLVGLYSVVYVALKKSKQIAQTSVMSGIINIITHLIMVNFIGIYAAPLSSAIAFGVMGIYRYYDIRKYIVVKLSSRYVVSYIVMYAVACVAYYSKSFVLKLVVLGVTIAYAALNNRKFIIGVYKTVVMFVSNNILKR